VWRQCWLCAVCAVGRAGGVPCEGEYPVRVSISSEAPPPSAVSRRTVLTLHVEYAERGKEYGILFICSLFSEYIRLEYIRIHVIYRVNKAEYGIHIRVGAP